MNSWQHLCVAVANPFTRHSLAVRKAGQIAATCGARITLFHAFSLPYPLNKHEPISSKDALSNAIQYRLIGLEAIADTLRYKGVHADCVVEWDFPAHEAIIRYVMKSKPDLLIADSNRHGRIGRWLLANTDWELVRHCPCPLWFVKSNKNPINLSVLAAVDPLHAHAKPSQLDDIIINEAKTVISNLGGSFQLIHGYQRPLSTANSNFIEPIRPPISADRSRRLVSSIKAELDKLAKRNAIPVSNFIIKDGIPSDVLIESTSNLKTDLLVMGAVSRRQLKRLFIGNTAEIVLDRVRCDLLIIKPHSFRTDIPRQTARSGFHVKGL